MAPPPPPPPPPVAPSPHRFLVSKKRGSSVSPAPRPVSSHWPDESTSSELAPSQFARPPRFSVPSAKPASPPLASPLLTRPNFAIPGTGPTLREEVQGVSPNDEDEEMLDNAPIEHDSLSSDISFGLEESLRSPVSAVLSSPKRRRIGDETDMSSQTQTQQTPSRFKLQADTIQMATFAENAIGTTNKAAFLRPSMAPPEPESPLPDAFSPHRRGQKFVPGGLAAEMQSWMVEAREAAMQSRRGKGYLHGEDYVYRIKVEKVDEAEPAFVEGRVVGASASRAMLVGGMDSIKVGDVVGIRAPTWEVRAQGTMWIVGYDWRVLK